jgi:hypothetical protein
VLEQLARIPYQAWERLAQRAIAHSRGRYTLARRVMERVVEARAQQDNEQFHLLILEDLLTQERATPLSRLRYRIVPRIVACPWHVAKNRGRGGPSRLALLTDVRTDGATRGSPVTSTTTTLFQRSGAA